MKPRTLGDFAYRARDAFCAGAGLAVLAPVLAVAAVAVKADSKGPIFFRQERIGRGGTPFRIHKFRSMHVDRPGLEVSTVDDHRITRVGRLMRLTKIDELPQLIDVLMGRMSLVGPRPEVSKYVAKWPSELRPIILSVRPGITDPASVKFRYESDVLAASEDPEKTYVQELLPIKAAMYAEYVRSRSFLGDINILWGTAKAIISSHDPGSGPLDSSLHPEA